MICTFCVHILWLNRICGPEHGRRQSLS